MQNLQSKNRTFSRIHEVVQEVKRHYSRGNRTKTLELIHWKAETVDLA